MYRCGAPAGAGTSFSTLSGGSLSLTPGYFPAALPGQLEWLSRGPAMLPAPEARQTIARGEQSEPGDKRSNIVKPWRGGRKRGNNLTPGIYCLNRKTQTARDAVHLSSDISS